MGNEKISSVKKVMGLYSIQSTPYEIRFGDRHLPINHLWFSNDRRKIPNTYFFYDESSVQRVIGSTDRWSSDFYTVEDKITMPLYASVLKEEKGIRLSIRNLSDYPILDCWVYVNGKFYPLGDVPIDSDQNRYISDLKYATDAYSHKRITKHYERYTQLSKNYVEAVESAFESRSDALLLTGWIPAGLIQVNVVNAKGKGHHLTLLQWEIPVKAHDEI
jgi:hypothetical protein